LGAGSKIWWEPPRNAMTTDLRRGKEITKKNIKKECLRREGYISPLRSAYPPKTLVTPLCMWGPMGDVITLAQFQLNRFRG